MTRLIAVLALASVCAFATPITIPSLTGSRSEGAGITATDEWGSDNGLFTIAWEITSLGGGSYHYKYTFSGFGSGFATITIDSKGKEKRDPSPGFSHWDLQLTTSCVDPGDSACVTNSKLNNVAIGSGDIELAHFGPDPLVDKNFWPTGGSDFWGVKFDVGGDGGPLVFEFDSNRAPVWGSFLAKGGSGNDNIAYNTGLVSGSALEIDYIARPNGAPCVPGTPGCGGGGGGTGEVPEPGTLSLLGLGAGLIIVSRKLLRR